MIEAREFFAAAGACGFGLYAGVPCSYLKPFINYAIDAPDLHYVAAANEGDAVAIATGAALAGLPAVAMFQNSGLGNAVNPLTSLNHVFRIPVLLITTLRGEPGGAPDEPQHELMGAITPGLLDLMQVAWDWFPSASERVTPVLDQAVAHMRETGRPYALVMRKDSVAGRALERAPLAPVQPAVRSLPPATPQATRSALLRAVQEAAAPGDLLVATTGYTGRELCALDDRDNQLYMVGSMGCASSLGLGLALARPDRRVIVLDGDGAALMRLGALATLGAVDVPNLVHVLLDNGMHESTGGQGTVSPVIDFCAIAQACGYSRAQRLADPGEVAAALRPAAGGLAFIHVPILPGVPAHLPRPHRVPEQLARRFADALGPRRPVAAP